MRKIDLFNEVKFGVIDKIAIITFPDKDIIDVYRRIPKTNTFFHDVFGKQDENGCRPCMNCGEIAWHSYTDKPQIFVYESDGNGVVTYIGHFDSEEDMFNDEKIASLNPVRYSFKSPLSMNEVYDIVKDEEQVFYIDNWVYDNTSIVCPACQVKEFSNTRETYTLDQVKEITNELLYDDCGILIICKEGVNYSVHINKNEIAPAIFVSEFDDTVNPEDLPQCTLVEES